MKHRYIVAFHTPLEWMPYYFRWNRQWTPLVVWYLGYSVFALFCGAVFLTCSVLFPLMVSSIRVGLLASLGTILWACYLHFMYLKWYDAWDDKAREAYLKPFWRSRFGMLPVRYYANHQRLRLALWYVAYSGIVAAGYGLLGLCGVALSYGADHSRYGWVVTVFLILWLGVVPAAIVIRHVRNVLAAPEPKAEEREATADWLGAQDPSDAAILASCSWSWFDDSEDAVRCVCWLEYDGTSGTDPSCDVWVRLDPPARDFLNTNGTHRILNERGQLTSFSRWPFVQRSKLPRGCDAVLFTADALAPRHRDDQEWTRRNYSFYLDTVDLLKRTTERQSIEVREWIVAHPRNRRILYSEERHYDLVTGNLVSRIVRSGYQYNAPVPPGVFRMPWWKPVLQVGNPRKEKQAAVSTPAREEIEAVIALSDAAWKAGDFADFELAWDFSALEEHVPRNRWRIALADQADRWSEWRSRVIDIWPSDHVGIPVNASSMELVPVPPGSVQVTVVISAVRIDGEPWTGRTMYVVTPAEAGAKIVFWNMLDVQTGLL